MDFVIGDGSGDVMLEIKAKAVLEDLDFVQALSYLKASGYKVGLLINFGPSVQIKRKFRQYKPKNPDNPVNPVGENIGRNQ